MPVNKCLDSRISFSPADPDQTGYQWDFCSGDLSLSPTASVFLNSSATGSPFKVELVQYNGNYFGFFTSRSARKLYRLDFGTDINNSPAVVDLGGLGVSPDGWLTVEIVNEGSNYYGFIIDFSNKIYRINFGSSLVSQPSNAEVIYANGLLNAPIDLAVLEQNDSKYLFVANFSSNNVTRLKFDQSFGDAPAALTIDNVTVTGSGGLAGISFLQQCDTWYAITTSLGGTIAKIEFVNGLSDSSPGINLLTGMGFTPAAPAGVSLVKENDNYHAFIQSNSASADLYRIDFGSTLSNNSPGGTNLGNLGILSGIWAFVMHKVKSKWLVLSSENVGLRVFKITFPNNCFSDVEFSTDMQPDVLATQAGTFSVSLTVEDSQGRLTSKTKNITVSGLTAPDIDISLTLQNTCILTDVDFNAQNTSGNVVGYDWDFDDMTPHGSGPATTHQFATSGIYNVTLDVTAANGCGNSAAAQVKIYPEPQASFTLPAGLICTNSDITFLNTTTDVFDGNLNYQWYIDSDAVSSSRDLHHDFQTPGAKTIKLEVSIPGCSDEESQTTSPLEIGPVVDFLVSGHCEDGVVQFTSDISETVSGYSWNFDDGSTSLLENPSHQFSDAGEFTVSLTASTAVGCNNQKFETITIYSKPEVDFTVNPPPSSCSGTETIFINDTPDPVDSNILTWNWNFDDPGVANTSLLQNPSHLFANPGTYDVSLSAATDQGCANTIQKEIIIIQSPQATINNSNACKSLPVNFSVAGSPVQSYYWEIGTSYYEVANFSHTFNTAGDHDVRLTVTGSNNCVAVVNKTLMIPETLTPDFSVTNHCVGYQAVITDITSGSDPVATRLWTIEGQDAGSGPATQFPFTSLGSKEIKLQVTSLAGCSYTRIKNISIASPPNAGFTAAPSSGAAPLNVHFNNTSSGATNFTWTFSSAAGATSTQVSPNYIFQELGEYNVQLVARNNEGCEDTAEKIVTAEAAFPDVDLRIITIAENDDGSLKVIITIQNKGNTILENLPVHINISGEVALREIIAEPIPPATMHNLILSYSITKADLKFLCATAALEGDQSPEGNRICKELGENGFIFTAYPNPVENELNIEWISGKDQPVSIFLIDAFGKRILKTDELSSDGLNRRTFDVRDLQSGIYFLRINNGFIQKTQRIFISPKN